LGNWAGKRSSASGTSGGLEGSGISKPTIKRVKVNIDS
jgi:hypothetical protein